MPRATVFNTPILFRLTFRGVLPGVDQWCWVCKQQTPQANKPREIIFLRIPTYVVTIPECRGQTDEQIEDLSLQNNYLRSFVR